MKPKEGMYPTGRQMAEIEAEAGHFFPAGKSKMPVVESVVKGGYGPVVQAALKLGGVIVSREKIQRG